MMRLISKTVVHVTELVVSNYFKRFLLDMGPSCIQLGFFLELVRN